MCPLRERLREREREREKRRERERERERERRERDRERGRERRREREREGREEREDSQDSCHRFAPSCFFIFLRAKTNHFPANGWCDSAHWGAAGLTCMRNGDYHGVIIEADLALPIACALPPPFLLWLVAYCTFSTPPSCTDLVGRSIRESREVSDRSSSGADKTGWNVVLG